jgi:UDP-N-acetylglucosamine diphosphorylase/glucosamine-1-phosphate N-acetyltransferase
MSTNKFILADFEEWDSLKPITLTRSIADIRIGILTLKEKWERWLLNEVGILTQSYLQPKYVLPKGDNFIYINASIIPNEQLIEDILSLKENYTLVTESGMPIASFAEKVFSDPKQLIDGPIFKTKTPLDQIKHCWDIFTLNGREIEADIRLMAIDPNGEKLSFTNSVYEPDNIFIEEGAKIECSILNAQNGPIYIGKNVEIMEGCMLRGPISIGDNSVIKMGTKIYGDTTIGPNCKIGGEISNAVFMGNSNKAHDGYLGNSVIGEWCNLGAGTNVSNLKNNYSLVESFDYTTNDFINTGLQFSGLIMGDHSKSSINSMFNTGTIVGVCCNIFGSNFPSKHIPSFSWGGSEGFEEYIPAKAFDVATKVMSRRQITFSETDRNILIKIFENTASHRIIN